MASVRRPAVLFAATALFGGLAAGSAAGHESAPDRSDRVPACRQEEPGASCPLARSGAGSSGSGTGSSGEGGGDTANGVLVSLGSVLLLTGSAAAVLRHGRRARP